jgi:hypothetical protein
MRYKNIKIIFLLIVFCIFTKPLLAANIHEPFPLKHIRFIEYQVIESNTGGNILTRTIKVIVQNTSNEILSNLKLIIDGLPNHVTVTNKEFSVPNLYPGNIAAINESIFMTIDLANIPPDGTRIIWQIECDVDGNDLFDETVVIEIF